MNRHRRRHPALWFVGGLAILLAGLGQRSEAAPGENEDLDAVLDRLERAGENVHDIRSKLVFETFNTVLEDRIIKTGMLLYKKQKPSATFLVRFDTIRQGGVISESREWHLFDGRWYTEARETTRQVIRREIVREGEEINPFELGKGPFPLPFGQKKAELVKLFDIELEPPVAGNPPRTTHLRCEPKIGTEMADKYQTLHLFVSDRLDLPVRIVAEQTDENIVTVIFEELEVNPAVAGSEFQLPAKTRDWDVETEPLDEPADP